MVQEKQGSPVRISLAEAGELPPYKEWRVATFHFSYDWETRRKRIWVQDGEGEYPFKDVRFAPNEFLYFIQADLPPPIASNGEGGPREITIRPRLGAREETATLPEVTPEEVPEYLRQRFFCLVDRIAPRGTFTEGETKGTGLGANRTPQGFDFTCFGGKFRVTIEKVG